MKVIAAFFKLVRWPNLVFIALTQVLFEYSIYYKVYGTSSASIDSNKQFFFILFASVLIAAAGYIINDYFDLNIDQVNKPNKVVVNSLISRRWVIFWHLFLSVSGLFFSILAFPIHGYWHLLLANLASILLLWFYSTNFKKQLLIGNIVISLLTAWVIVILYFSKYPLKIAGLLKIDPQEIRFFRFTILFASFAFVISLIREVIKDMEDADGDRKYGCRTMPIVWGINASKVFVAVWLVVLISAILILQLYVLSFAWWYSIIYCLLCIVTPLLWILWKLFLAQTPAQFHQLSSVVKFVMFTGILSMIFFRIYS